MMSAVAELPCTLALDQRIVDRRRSTERGLHFDSPTHTRVNSESCVNDGYCLRHFSVDTAPLTYFSSFPSRTLPRSTRTMMDSGKLWSSISLHGYVDFFYIHGARQLWALYRQPLACDLLWKRRKHQQTDIHNSKVSSSHSIVDQAVRIALLTVFGRSAASARSGAGAATFRSNRKYRYRPHTQSDVGNCWPWM